MPLYDYICAACGRRFEVIHGVHDPAPEACPLCGSGPIRKAFAPPTIVFKGSGWAKKERRSASGGAKKTSDESGEKKTSDESGEKSSPTSPSDKTSSGDASSSGSSSSTSTSTSTTSSSSSD